MIDKIAYPTVGRIVHYHDPDYVEPWPAIVVAADENRYTIPTLTVFVHDGIRVEQYVPHASEPVEGAPYWDWMAYQKGQAAKTERLQEEMDKRTAELQRLSQPARLVQSYDAVMDERGKTRSSTPSPEDGKR